MSSRRTTPPLPAATSPAGRPEPERWSRAGVEPTLTELMADPLTTLIMRRDGINEAHVHRAVNEARWRLRLEDRSALPCPPVAARNPHLQASAVA